MQHNLFYDWKHHLKPFGLGGAIKRWEDKGSLTLLTIDENIYPKDIEGIDGVLINDSLCSNYNNVLNILWTPNTFPDYKSHRVGLSGS